MTWIIENDSFEDSLRVEDVWHEDHRWKNQILSRCHGTCFSDIFYEEDLYKVKIYLDCGTVDMTNFHSFSTLEEAKEFAIKEMNHSN